METADQQPISDMGENALLAQLLQSLPSNKSLLTGPGDDCAVCRRDADWDELLKTDVVVEGVHFLRNTDAQLIGHKALARALSDIAAMGGLPEHALISLLLHPSRPLSLLRGIYAGISALAERYGVSVAGGETSSLPFDGLVINVALTGRVEHGKAFLRSGAREGDILCVSGRLGGSFPSGRHLDFEPRLELARWLRRMDCQPNAAMDLSDGLAADLPKLAEASACAFELWEDALPCHEGCSPQQALCDGEDYELLMAFAPEVWQRLQSLPAPQPLSAIGRIRAKGKLSLSGGWQHFRA